LEDFIVVEYFSSRAVRFVQLSQKNIPRLELFSKSNYLRRNSPTVEKPVGMHFEKVGGMVSSFKMHTDRRPYIIKNKSKCFEFWLTSKVNCAQIENIST
jgi:hypothetical protein